MQANTLPQEKYRQKGRSISSQTRRARKRRLIEAYGLTCFWCHKTLTYETATMDHFVPFFQGGASNVSNLRLACDPCNQARHVKRPNGAMLYYRTLMKSESTIRNRLFRCRQEGLVQFVDFLAEVLIAEGYSLDDLHRVLAQTIESSTESAEEV